MKKKQNKLDINSITYSDAGVDISKGDELISQISPITKSTAIKGTTGELGGFGGLFDLKKSGFKDPILVSSTDGVGTKLQLAIETKSYFNIGIDLVAMCANDVLAQGAIPLFFMDYYATGKLNNEVAIDVIKGIAEGCKQSGCALIGGETAEMPKLYKTGDFDIAGFCVGIAEKKKLLPRTNINTKDCIIGIKSSGLHSNGYSLINHMLDQKKIRLNDKIGAQTLGSLLIKPTKIYTEILNIKSFSKIKAIANITGGGLTENIPRVLPNNVNGLIDFKKINMPKIFLHIQDRGNIDNKEMLKVLNCGVGMTLVANKKDAQSIINDLKKLKLNSSIIGEIVKGKGKSHIEYINI